MQCEEGDLHLDKASLDPILFRPTQRGANQSKPINQIGPGR